MKRSFILGFFFLVMLDTITQIAFKLTADETGPLQFASDWVLSVLTRPTFVVIVVAMLLAFVTYMTLMKDAPVGPLFAAAHLELVTVSVISIALFGERLNLIQVAGCLLIIGGVTILGVTEKQDPA